MNSAILFADAIRIDPDHGHAPQRVMTGCLLASVAVHALMLVWLPGWMQPAAPLPAPVLEVVMVPVKPELVPAPVLRAAEAPAQPRVVQSLPRRVGLSPQVAQGPQSTEGVPVARPETVTQPADTAVITGTARVVSAPSATASATIFLPATATAPVRVEGASTPPAFNAAYLRNPPPRYPPAARRNGDEGQVMLKVLVNIEGAPVRVELDQSSGSSLLDGAALEAVRGWRFVPARRGVQNVEGWVRVPLVFRLES